MSSDRSKGSTGRRRAARTHAKPTAGGRPGRGGSARARAEAGGEGADAETAAGRAGAGRIAARAGLVRRPGCARPLERVEERALLVGPLGRDREVVGIERALAVVDGPWRPRVGGRSVEHRERVVRIGIRCHVLHLPAHRVGTQDPRPTGRLREERIPPPDGPAGPGRTAGARAHHRCGGFRPRARRGAASGAGTGRRARGTRSGGPRTGRGRRSRRSGTPAGRAGERRGT